MRRKSNTAFFSLSFLFVFLSAMTTTSFVISQNPTQVPFETAVFLTAQKLTLTLEPTDPPNLQQTPDFSLSATPVENNTDWVVITETFDDIEMVFVPPGCFQMGSSTESENVKPDEQPQHRVCLTSGYWLDKYEVTNEAFQKFIDDNGYEDPQYWSEEGWDWLQTAQASGVSTPHDYGGSTEPNKSRVGVSWYEAEAYAHWRGGRLPTEAEWEYAARGPNAWIYPWGNEYDPTYANVGSGVAQPVGTYENGKSWVGAYDMAGNVWEWVKDWYSGDYYERFGSETVYDPTAFPTSQYPVIRGGSWFLEQNDARSAVRSNKSPGDQLIEIGIRVVIPKTNGN